MVRRTFIDACLDRLFPKPSFEQQLAEDMELQRRLALATQESIRRKQFDLHMTLSRIVALDAWTAGNVRKDLS